jgi:RimJ/RimL family protein N-acetyltransferase
MELRIEPWGSGDLPLLEKLLGDPAMMEHLGGPETHDQLVERQKQYERLAETGMARRFKIVDEATGDPMGSVVYWDRAWRGEDVFEIGWSVLPQFQGRGVAGKGTALAIDEARSQKKHRFMYAFPSVDNAPSNGICRKLGFVLIGETEFEYPKGSFMRCNEWRLDLFALN